MAIMSFKIEKMKHAIQPLVSLQKPVWMREILVIHDVSVHPSNPLPACLDPGEREGVWGRGAWKV